MVVKLDGLGGGGLKIETVPAGVEPEALARAESGVHIGFSSGSVRVFGQGALARLDVEPELKGIASSAFAESAWRRWRRTLPSHNPGQRLGPGNGLFLFQDLHFGGGGLRRRGGRGPLRVLVLSNQAGRLGYGERECGYEAVLL